MEYDRGYFNHGRQTKGLSVVMDNPLIMQNAN